MSNYVYNVALKAFLDGDIDLLTDTIKVRLCSAYTDAATDTTMTPTTSYKVGTDDTIEATKSTTAGVFDSTADCEWTAVTGDQVTEIVIYKFVTDDAGSTPICHMDTFASGFPFTPNGGDFTLTWHASGIFSI